MVYSEYGSQGFFPLPRLYVIIVLNISKITKIIFSQFLIIF